MGSGKSTVGKKLANKMNFQFIDLDKFIEDSTGKSITEIFETRGENYFRDIEHKCLRNIENQTNTLVSCGGGTPCFFDNMQWMNTKGITVYLQMNPLSLVSRLKQGKNERPLLKGKSDEDMLNFISNSLTEREKYYTQAHITVKVEGLKTGELQRKIIEFRK